LIAEANNERDEALDEVQRLEEVNLKIDAELRETLAKLDSQVEKGNMLQAEKLSLERVLEERKERLTKLEADYEKLQQELIAIVKNLNK